MGLQLIFAVETNKTCKSDWIYIKDTIDRFYKCSVNSLKLSIIYMNGKTNYRSREKDVRSLINQYDRINNKSKVIYCIDCDNYDSKPEDKKFIDNIIKFCEEHDYECVWFCKDIESVYWGEKVSNNQKKNKAISFKKNRMIDNINEKNISVTTYKINTSNILTILDKFIEQGTFERKGIN